ncbi:MAG: hypothetical protein ING19_09530 [Azospirillum sp.]|nr:hypothetical protein [Azospirillum sp.]
MLDLARRAGLSNPRQIYRYLRDPRTGKPRRIPAPDLLARIAVETDMLVQPSDWYEEYLKSALHAAAKSGRGSACVRRRSGEERVR